MKTVTFDENKWVMVPKEPTEDMVIAGFESEPDESFSEPEEWEAYEAMSGCQQAAHKAKLCWASMLAAAPSIPSICNRDEFAEKKQTVCDEMKMGSRATKHRFKID